MIRCLNCMKIFDEAYDVCPHCGQLVGAAPEIAFHIYPGTVLNDRYVIGTAVGHGGFGITYNAWDNQLNTHVAIKEYYPNGLVNRIPGTSEVLLLSGQKEKQYYAGLNQFLQEARQTVQFSEHPNIVHVFNFFQANNTAYIVMEFLDGISLKGLLKQWGGRLQIDQAIEVCTMLCDALTEIHKHKILHRDINPSNIYICLNGGVKLIDFGSARISDDENEKTRSIIITPGYAPPEQYRSKSKQGAWTDIYALCAVLYRCVTGVRPIESLDRTVDDTLDNPMVLNEEVEEWLDKVIMRGMALNQEIRFRSTEELKAALLKHEKVEYPEEKIKKKKKARIIGFACALTAILGTAAGVGIWFATHKTLSLADMEIEDADITIWVKESEKACYESIVEKFDSNYGDKDINVEIIAVNESEYAEKLVQAIEDNECPDIFYTEFLDKEQYDELADITVIYDSIDLSSYQYLSEYRDKDNSDIMLPLGYDQLSMFVNKSKTGLTDDNTISEINLKDLTEITGNNEGGCTADVHYDEFLADYSDIDCDEDSMKKFVEQEAYFYISGACAYKTIQNECRENENFASTVAGNYYAVPVISEGESFGVYEKMVGVSKSSDENEEKAAEFFISYLLSEQAQDIMHIQNEGALPLQEDAFERFIEYNTMIKYIEEYRGDLKISD